MTSSAAIAFPYVADRFGGSTASSLTLARALADAGHRVHILSHGDGRLIDEASGLSLPVTFLPPLSNVASYTRPDRFRIEQMLAFRTCRSILGDLNVDIVHTNDCAMLRTWAMPAYAANVSLVAHWRTNFRKSWSVEAGLRVARAVIAVSRFSRAQLPQWVQPKTIVEYNPIRSTFDFSKKDAIRARIRSQLGLPRNAALIGIFGNHTERKRTHVLADVLRALTTTEDGRPIFGIACGAKVEPYDLLLEQKIKKYSLQHRLLLPGFVRPSEDWIAACDVLLAPAVEEPLARNVLEAQSLKVPAVVSLDGGLRELIKNSHSGFLCDPHDIPGWIAQTRRILNDRTLRIQMAASAFAAIASLNPENYARRVAMLYRSLIDNDRSHSEVA